MTDPDLNFNRLVPVGNELHAEAIAGEKIR
jgi:hypothetical protein